MQLRKEGLTDRHARSTGIQPQRSYAGSRSDARVECSAVKNYGSKGKGRSLRWAFWPRVWPVRDRFTKEKPIGLGTRGLCVCVCVCVCMVVCYQYSGIIERKNMAKILIEVEKSPFQLDFQLFTSRVHGWRKSYTIWEYDHHIHSSYFFAIRFSIYI